MMLNKIDDDVVLSGDYGDDNNNSGHLIDALHKKYHSALQKGNKLHYFSCTNHNTSL